MTPKPTRHPLEKKKKDIFKKLVLFSPLTQLLETAATRGHGGRKYQQHNWGIRDTHVQQVCKWTQGANRQGSSNIPDSECSGVWERAADSCQVHRHFLLPLYKTDCWMYGPLRRTFLLLLKKSSPKKGTTSLLTPQKKKSQTKKNPTNVQQEKMIY